LSKYPLSKEHKLAFKIAHVSEEGEVKITFSEPLLEPIQVSTVL